MGDLLGSFPISVRMRTKHAERLVLVCRVSQKCLKSSRILQMVSEQTSPSMMWFGDEPSRSCWACNTQGRQWQGVVVGAQGMTMSGSRQLLDEPNHIGMREILRPCRYGLHGWRKAYKNCLILPIWTRCLFFLVDHSIRSPQLNMFDLE